MEDYELYADGKHILDTSAYHVALREGVKLSKTCKKVHLWHGDRAMIEWINGVRRDL